MNPLNHLNSLRAIEAAARHRSYTLAAAELFVTQAAISQQVRQVEAWLGIKLFVRQGRQMQPTAKGQQLAEQLSQGFATIGEAVKRLKCEPLEGELNITTTQSFATMMLSPALGDFNRRYPEVQLKVWASTAMEDLHHGSMDVAIRYGFTEYAGLSQRTLLEDELVPLCSPALCRDGQLTNAAALRHCWLIDSTQTTGRDWPAWFACAGIDMQPGDFKWISVSNLDMALSTALSGHGVFLGSRRMARAFIEAGSLVNPINLALPSGIRYSLLHDPQSPRLARIQLFENWLLERFAS
ncbi:LysR family transcriptional regulator [Shewanella cyperi]|uniref:LysR family transcriptional regulator n=1 Tax=Shewanella cyperi TaxID=2814292 RepID=A0A974XLJ8_9GAMM|nr:LysR substrate-binding domain-containing protein [Shewanella cyperi]QSX30665.1 LysR family transcriptional regulator [Shewanella cyperi]